MFLSGPSARAVFETKCRTVPRESTYAQGSSPQPDYTVRVSRVLVQKGSAAIDFAAPSAQEFGRGGNA
jgi:hypothetical protein